MNKKLQEDLDELENIIQNANHINANKQLELIQQIAETGEEGQEILLNILIERKNIKINELKLLDGILFEILNKTQLEIIRKKMEQHFQHGLINLKHPLNLEYQPLQTLLISQKFQEADKLTQSQLCKLAGLTENHRQWLYFTDIANLPVQDLEIIDILWRIYSRGKFGFSIQRKIWLSYNGNWEKLWNKIGWKKQGVLCRYPNEFIWHINAPVGHLPLFNQLRGTQVLVALFKHIAWNQKIYS